MHFLNSRTGRAAGLIVGALLTLALTAGSCSDKPTTAQSEGQIRDNSYDGLAARQKAHTMDYSPTRDQINFWIDTWGHQPGKLSYVYLQAGNGQLIGYYIFKGLPVSYCTALTPTWTYEGTPDDGSDIKDQRVPAPGVDGVYYSGGQCNSFYGKDATTGAYLEFTAGGSQNVLIYDRPLPRQNVEPLGFTKVEDVKK
jgi:hypothetical protein